MRLLVAENDARVRSALTLLLKQQPDWVIAECANLDGLAAQVHEFKPDLLLLDWELPGRRRRCCSPSTGPVPPLR